LAEWLTLGLLLQQLRPDRFSEVVLALRDAVGVHPVAQVDDWDLSQCAWNQPPKA
jgi:hypothetical protein